MDVLTDNPGQGSCAAQQVLIHFLFYLQECVYVHSSFQTYPFPSPTGDIGLLFSASVTPFLFSKEVHLYHFLKDLLFNHVSFVRKVDGGERNVKC